MRLGRKEWFSGRHEAFTSRFLFLDVIHLEPGYRTRRSRLRCLTGGERLTLRPTPPQSTRQPDSVKSL